MNQEGTPTCNTQKMTQSHLKQGYYGRHTHMHLMLIHPLHFHYIVDNKIGRNIHVILDQDG